MREKAARWDVAFERTAGERADNGSESFDARGEAGGGGDEAWERRRVDPAANASPRATMRERLSAGDGGDAWIEWEWRSWGKVGRGAMRRERDVRVIDLGRRDAIMLEEKCEKEEKGEENEPSKGTLASALFRAVRARTPAARDIGLPSRLSQPARARGLAWQEWGRKGAVPNELLVLLYSGASVAF